jgi:hypothetical protein
VCYFNEFVAQTIKSDVSLKFLLVLIITDYNEFYIATSFYVYLYRYNNDWRESKKENIHEQNQK